MDAPLVRHELEQLASSDLGLQNALACFEPTTARRSRLTSHREVSTFFSFSIRDVCYAKPCQNFCFHNTSFQPNRGELVKICRQVLRSRVREAGAGGSFLAWGRQLSTSSNSRRKFSELLLQHMSSKGRQSTEVSRGAFSKLTGVAAFIVLLFRSSIKSCYCDRSAPRPESSYTRKPISIPNILLLPPDRNFLDGV